MRSRSTEYHEAYRRHTKDSIARDVVNTIIRRGGRFLSQLDPVPRIRGLEIPANSRVWVEADEGVVLIKAKQALRDHSEGSKDARPHAKRRPAAGSGNMVLEWVVSSTAPPATVSASPATAAVEQPQVTAAASATTPFNAASVPPQSQLASLLSPQQLSLLQQPTGSLNAFSLPPLTTAHGGNIPLINNALLLAATQQAQPGIHNLLSTQASRAVLNSYGLSPLLTTHPIPVSAVASVAETNTLGTLASFAQGASETSASLRRLLEGQTSSVTASDPDLATSRQSASSGSASLPPPVVGSSAVDNSVASRASLAVDQCVAQAGGEVAPDQVALCGLEVSLLRVLCNVALPLWNGGTQIETSGELPGASSSGLEQSWSAIAKQLEATEAAALASNRTTALAQVALCLVARCLECARTSSPAETPVGGRSLLHHGKWAVFLGVVSIILLVVRACGCGSMTSIRPTCGLTEPTCWRKMKVHQRTTTTFTNMR